jgi:hypothetical protein
LIQVTVNAFPKPAMRNTPELPEADRELVRAACPNSLNDGP